MKLGGRKFSVRTVQISVIVFCALAFYGYSVTFGYVLDDKLVVTDNQFVQKGIQGIGDIFTTEGFEGYFGEKRDLIFGARYRPLSLAMFAIERSMTPLPWLGHLVNVLLYALLGYLIYVWSSRNFRHKKKRRWYLAVPFMIAILYVLHPIHSEAVANIKGRDEILAMLLSILTLLVSQRYARSGKIIDLVSVFPLFLMALLAKEHSITFLAIIPVTLWWIDKASYKRIGLTLTPIILAVASYMMLRYNAVGYLIPQSPAVTPALMNDPFLGMTELERSATIMYTLGKYLYLMIFPHPLTHDYYPYHIPKSTWSDPFVIFSVISYAVLILLVLWRTRKTKWVLWSFLFFVITILPMSNIFFTVGTFMNERFLFMPSLGYVIVLALLINYLTRKSSLRSFGIILYAILIVGYGLKTALRVPDWESGQSLNRAAIDVSKNSARINMFYATDLFNYAQATQNMEHKRLYLAEAKKYLEKSKKIHPLYSNANHMLAGVCAESFKVHKDINRVLNCFKDVARHRPDTEYLDQFLYYLENNGYSREVGKFYEEAGYDILYTERNNYPQAIRYLKKAEELLPGTKSVYEKLSAVYLAFAYHLQDYPDPNYKVTEIIETGRYYGNLARQ